MLLSETNIIDIVKQIRFFKLALKQLLTSDQIEELKEKSHIISIDPDEKEEENEKEEKSVVEE